MRQLAEDDPGAEPAPSLGERQAAQQGVEQRRLAAPVRAEHRDAFGPGELEVERAEPKRAALDDGALEPHDDIAAALARREVEPQLPGLVRLVDALEPLDPPGEGLLDILRLLLLAALAIAALLPLLHAPLLGLEPRFLALVLLVCLALSP